MSAGDYISLRRARALKGTYTTRDSGLNTIRTRINETLQTVVLDKYEDVIPNSWFNVPNKTATTCITCSTISGGVTDECTDEYNPVIPLISTKNYSTIKTECTFVVHDETFTVVPINVTAVNLLYDISTGGVVILYDE